MESKVIGIIAEYNPFHDGHKYQIEESKRITGAEFVVAAISGDFTQRGAPALYDKWNRAELAIAGGVDLVVQIPTVFACNSAEYFAKGGVDILEGLGIIDYLSFGSECGNIEVLKRVSATLKNEYANMHESIKLLTKQGFSYPVAREKALQGILNEEELKILSEPNNLLGIEYLKVIKNMQPMTITRKGAGYHETATKIRRRIEEELGGVFSKQEEKLYELIVLKVISQEASELENIISSGQGLGYKLKKIIRKCNSREELIDNLKSKAYTQTRITRFLTHVLLNLKNRDLCCGTNYIRVLGLNENGAKILKHIKKEKLNSLPIITNINKDINVDDEIWKRLKYDVIESDVYNLINGKDLYKNSEFTMKPYTNFFKGLEKR